MTLEAPEHQEINGKVEVTWRTLRAVAHSLMVHARVSEAYIHFALMYTIDQIFPVLPIKDLINENVYSTTSFKLATGTKPSVSHLTPFCQCVQYLSVQHMDKITRVNVILKVLYLLQVRMTWSNIRSRLSDLPKL